MLPRWSLTVMQIILTFLAVEATALGSQPVTCEPTAVARWELADDVVVLEFQFADDEHMKYEVAEVLKGGLEKGDVIEFPTEVHKKKNLVQGPYLVGLRDNRTSVGRWLEVRGSTLPSGPYGTELWWPVEDLLYGYRNGFVPAPRTFPMPSTYDWESLPKPVEWKRNVEGMPPVLGCLWR